jgi:hypothetical protein
MAATRPESAHGDDVYAAELLTIQNGGMDSGNAPFHAKDGQISDAVR